MDPLPQAPAGWPSELVDPVYFHVDHVGVLGRAPGLSSTRFGGPSTVEFVGVPHGPRRLHHVATLACDSFPGIAAAGSGVALCYGLAFDDCRLTYAIESPTRYRVLELEPTVSSDDWPYPDYPDLLPELPLRVARRLPATATDFRRWLGLGCDVSPDELTLVIPPLEELGMSLWGPEGDAEGVRIVFRWDVVGGRIRAHNEVS